METFSKILLIKLFAVRQEKTSGLQVVPFFSSQLRHPNNIFLFKQIPQKKTNEKMRLNNTTRIRSAIHNSHRLVIIDDVGNDEMKTFLGTKKYIDQS